MMAFRLVPVFALALMAASAQAQTTTTGDEMVVSGPSAAPPPANTQAAGTSSTGTSTPMTTDEQVKAWLANAPKLEHTPTSDAMDDTGTPAPRQIHGSAGVAVGSNGYSSAYVSSLIPIGKDSTLGLAVSQTDYGGGTLDHGRIRLPKGRSQSVAVSLQLGNAQGDVPADCPGFMDGGRYIEPVWVSRLHPDMACTTETEKHAETDTTGQQ